MRTGKSPRWQGLGLVNGTSVKKKNLSGRESYHFRVKPLGIGACCTVLWRYRRSKRAEMSILPLGLALHPTPPTYAMNPTQHPSNPTRHRGRRVGLVARVGGPVPANAGAAHPHATRVGAGGAGRGHGAGGGAGGEGRRCVLRAGGCWCLCLLLGLIDGYVYAWNSFSSGSTQDQNAHDLIKLLPNKTGVYASAHWCGPCRQFTPMLAQFYTRLKALGKPFEVVFARWVGHRLWCLVGRCQSDRRTATIEAGRARCFMSVRHITPNTHPRKAWTRRRRPMATTSSRCPGWPFPSTGTSGSSSYPLTRSVRSD